MEGTQKSPFRFGNEMGSLEMRRVLCRAHAHRGRVCRQVQEAGAEGFCVEVGLFGTCCAGGGGNLKCRLRRELTGSAADFGQPLKIG